MVEVVSHHHLGRRIYQLSPLREHGVSPILVCDMHLLLVLRVGNKKLAHIFEGKITTQPRRSTPPDRHLDVQLQLAAS